MHYDKASLEDLTAHIKKEFPDLTFKNSRLITEGWDHLVVVLDEKFVFRFPNEDFYTVNLNTEITVLQNIAPKLKVRVPYYEFIAKDRTFAGYKMIEGQALMPELYQKLSAADQDLVVTLLADFLSKIHNFKPEDYGNAKVAESYAANDHSQVKTDTKKYLENVLSKEDYELCLKTNEEVDKMLKSNKIPSVFIHNDIYPRHIIWNGSAKVLGIIDFSDMNIGDAAFDFAEFFVYGEDFVNRVYEKYAAKKDSGLLDRALLYWKWMGVYMMVDYFEVHKTSFKEARELFDISKYFERSAQ